MGARKPGLKSIKVESLRHSFFPQHVIVLPDQEQLNLLEASKLLSLPSLELVNGYLSKKSTIHHQTLNIFKAIVKIEQSVLEAFLEKPNRITHFTARI